MEPRSVFGLTICGWLVLQAASAQSPRPPATRVETVVDSTHGVSIADPYRWLEDQQSAATREWIVQQNAYTRAVLDSGSGRERLRAELESLARVDIQDAPIVRKGRYFFSKKNARQEQAAICMRNGADGADRVLVDPATLSRDGSVSAFLMNVSPDGSTIAWGKRAGGQDEIEVSFLNVNTGETMPDRLPRGLYYSVFLLPDRKGVLYSQRTTQGTRLHEHRLGAPPSQDRELFGAGLSDDKLIWFSFAQDGSFVVAFVNEGAGSAVSKVYLLNRAKGESFEPLITNAAANFQGSIGGHTLFLKTNWNATNGRVLAIDLDRPTSENWKEIVPTSKDSVIMSAVPLGQRLVVSYLRDVTMRLAVHRADGKPIRDLRFPTLGSGFVSGGAEWNSSEVFFSFQSYAHPLTIYRHDIATGRQTVWFRQSPQADTDSIETRQVWFASKDGTRIPMFLVMQKGVRRDGNRPVLLEGYGGYGSVSTPWFNPMAVLWSRRGGIYAFANIRGGGEFGEEWHRAGMLDKKQNSFDDFISAAEWLVREKYTRPERLAIQGGSNGGLLVGAALTQRPELFRAVVCLYPHLDMLRFHKFLKAAPWVKEYGNPDVREEFAYLHAYSPYHRVRDGVRYPAVLFMTGDSDTRVAPLHARKMTARLQAATLPGQPILLRYEGAAGHSGGGSTTQQLDQLTDQMAFLYSQLGIKD